MLTHFVPNQRGDSSNFSIISLCLASAVRDIAIRVPESETHSELVAPTKPKTKIWLTLYSWKLATPVKRFEFKRTSKFQNTETTFFFNINICLLEKSGCCMSSMFQMCHCKHALHVSILLPKKNKEKEMGRVTRFFHLLCVYPMRHFRNNKEHAGKPMNFQHFEHQRLRNTKVGNTHSSQPVCALSIFFCCQVPGAQNVKTF